MQKKLSNLIEYSRNYFKTTGSLWQYYTVNCFKIIMLLLLIFLLIIITVLRLNLKQK